MIRNQFFYQVLLIMIYFIIILLIIISLLLIKKNNLVEGYSERLTDQTIEKCADFCRSKAGCWAFGYDKKNNICYPSKEIIAGYPIDSVFKSEYRDGNVACNKVKAILQPIENPSFADRRSNSLYVCKDNINSYPKYYIYRHGRFDDVGEGNNLDNIFDIDNYNVVSYDFPINKYNPDQQDLYTKYLETKPFTNVTKEDRDPTVTEYVPIYVEKDKEKNEFDFNITGLTKRYNDIKNNVQQSIPTINFDKKKDIQIPQNKDMTYTVFEPYDKRYTNEGIYLSQDKCIKNVPINTCANNCRNNDQCTGFEYNTDFKNQFDVCCLYKTVGPFNLRTFDKNNGQFYKKTYTTDITKNDVI